MMLFGIAVLFTLSIAEAQRPGYLSSGGSLGLPDLAARFRDTTSSAPDLGNRLGETGGSTSKIPIDARGDVDLIKRVNEWPRPNRPFWVLNAEHIERQRNTNPGQANLGQTNPTQNEIFVNNPRPSSGVGAGNGFNLQRQPDLIQRFGEGNSDVPERRQPSGRHQFIPGSLP